MVWRLRSIADNEWHFAQTTLTSGYYQLLVQLSGNAMRGGIDDVTLLPGNCTAHGEFLARISRDLKITKATKYEKEKNLYSWESAILNCRPGSILGISQMASKMAAPSKKQKLDWILKFHLSFQLCLYHWPTTTTPIGMLCVELKILCLFQNAAVGMPAPLTLPVFPGPQCVMAFPTATRQRMRAVQVR